MGGGTEILSVGSSYHTSGWEGTRKSRPELTSWEDRPYRDGVQSLGGCGPDGAAWLELVFLRGPMRIVQEGTVYTFFHCFV